MNLSVVEYLSFIAINYALKLTALQKCRPVKIAAIKNRLAILGAGLKKNYSQREDKLTKLCDGSEHYEI